MSYKNDNAYASTTLMELVSMVEFFMLATSKASHILCQCR